MKKSTKQFKLSLPHPYLVLIIVAFVAVILTWVVPAGNFERTVDAVSGRNVIVPGTYTVGEQTPVGLWGFILALYQGMLESADIIFFIIFGSAYVGMFTSTGTMNSMVGALLRKLGKRDQVLLPVLFIVFGLCGSMFGVYQEFYALMPAMVTVAMTMGYDRLVGGSLVYVAIATSYSASISNPFNVGIASAIAQVPMIESGVTTMRVISFVILEGAAILYIMKYASRIRKDPTKSYMYGVEEGGIGGANSLTREQLMQQEFTLPQKLTLVVFIISIITMGVTISVFGWYFQELSGLFIVSLIITGLINKLTPNDMCDVLTEAGCTMMVACLASGFAFSISYILEQGNIMDTIVNVIGSTVAGLPSSLSGVGMFIAQTLINFFIPSAVGQAVVTMPLMNGIADLSGFSRQLSVLAYQFGDGFSNMLWPTAFVSTIAVFGVKIDKWLKFITPLIGIMFVLQLGLMIVAAAIL